MPMNFTPNQALDQREAEQAKAEQEAKERQRRPIITSLAGYVRTVFEASREAKQKIEQEDIESLRQRNGIYSPAKLTEIRANGGSEIFMMLTDEKCSAVTSWLADILFPGGETPWSVSPTPVPDLKPEQQAEIEQAVQAEFQAEIMAAIQANFQAEVVQAINSGQINSDAEASQFMQAKAAELFNPAMIQEEMQARAEEMGQEIRQDMESKAKEARDRVETKLQDVIVEAGWENAVHEALDDISTFKAGVIKGPVLRHKKKMKWLSPQPQDGMVVTEEFQGKANQVVEVVEEVSIDFNRVSPFDIYPLPNARIPEDGLIERHRLTRRYLTSLIGIKGYDDDAIRMVLKEYGTAGQFTWLSISNDQTRQDLENRPNEWRSPEAMIDALQFWGNVQGLKLLEYGMSPEEIEDPFSDYAVEVWLIGNYVIKAEINGDPLGRVPYHFASFRKRNGSIWGAGPPEIIRDSQEACNATARAMINNLAISSGPQVTVDVSQLPPGTNITDLKPWKIWQFNGQAAIGSTAKSPIGFFAPPSVTRELMEVYQFYASEADNKTGIPKYSYGGGGESSGGALGTATGFSMMMNNASRGIKNVVRNIDNGIIKPSIERTHEFQLLFFNDPEYHQGDIKIIAKGSSSLVAKEQAAVRRNELLQVVTGSETVLNIIGQKGLASMLREIFKSADFQDDEIVPGKREMLQREQQNQAAMQQEQALIQQEEQAKLDQETDPAGNVAGGKDVRTV
ncbi:MAG: hypothetical protein DRH26_00050 [Deltaproteobacteria bacterium]|nr:MAG: hypothetical protein DRH26_00050 [Deltaproteobacteria bacterium]